jgi:uncharacterized UPF0160 family protein
MESQLKTALEEIRKVRKKNDEYIKEIESLKKQIMQLKDSDILVAPRKTTNIDSILRAADEAMQRNVEKIRREMECRAKTKREVTGLKG